ncbi:endonuclease 2-like [Cryptomeria japonica]|uniref:endonuclease 2-like n=1 Tax=Cryptomeria japonica TaxID=3369 RepID=UPI0025AB68A6|nr:endonuclease 2-like [Cryptomeria japonica]
MGEFIGRYCVLIGVGILLTVTPVLVQGWGKEGHYSTCKIAQPFLNENTWKAVNELLPHYAQNDLASLCSWADHMRFRYHWANSLHFIDTPDNVCSYDYSRDCHNEHGVEGMCLEGAIKNYTSQLVTYDHKSHGKHYNLTEALLFLSHFMGDIHQPLHVGFTSDRGGNSIKLHWYRRKSNLHHIWDSGIIQTSMKDFYDNDLEAMIEDIQTNITEIWSNDVTAWEECQTDEISCPKLYADESIILACKWAYQDVEEDDILEDDYFLSRLPIIENQLAKGGIRLAATLNRIFDSKEDYTLHSEL